MAKFDGFANYRQGTRQMTVNESTVRWKARDPAPSTEVQVSPSTADVQVTVRPGEISAVTDCP